MKRPVSLNDAPTQVRDLPWKDAIQNVLTEADGALHYTEIAERIVSKGLRKSVGATPASTVSVFLNEGLKGDPPPYLRVAAGVYTLKAVAERPVNDPVEAAKKGDQAAETGALRAFGMFWSRDRVLWSATPKLLGTQGAGASEVNFAEQVGVYLLHDRDRVIYVGRTTDTLAARLKWHTTDRLSGRWDRFSWFGLRSVGNDGKLSNSKVPWSQEVVIETMEALLIESLEPPLNRKRGDNLTSIEYIQFLDPQIEASKRRAILNDMMKGVGP